MRIAIAGFSDETCTFCKDPTPIERFEPYALRGQAILNDSRGIPNYINGYMKVLEAEGVEIVPIVYASKGGGGFSSWLTPDCFDKYSNEIRDGLKAAGRAGRIDGVLLSLHGAMAASGAPKPEAEIVRRARQAVGDAPIMVTLDLHANEDHELADTADGVFILKTYPHVDSEEIGIIAAKCMVGTVKGEFKPTMAARKPGIISASIYQASAFHPMKDIFDRCREWEKKPGVYCVSVAPGYAYADVVDVGMSVFAVTNGDKALAEKVAQDVSDFAWTLKESFAAPLPGTEESVRQAMELVAAGKGPVLLADGADRIGDSTHLLKELMKKGARNWAVPCIADPNACEYLEKNHKTGDTVTITAGGWYDQFSGTPAEITGRIAYMGRPAYVLIGPMEKGRKVQERLCCHIDLGGNRHVVIAQEARWVLDGSSFTAVGIDFRNLDIIALKDRVHHRAFWDSVTKVNIRTSVPGQGPADLRILHYDNLPDDVFPIGKKWRKG